MSRDSKFNIFLIIGLFAGGIFLGHEIVNSPALKKATTVIASIGGHNRDYEFVDISVGCQCGNQIKADIPVDANSWPLIYFCARCKMRYTILKEDKPPQIYEWADYYGWRPDK